MTILQYIDKAHDKIYNANSFYSRGLTADAAALRFFIRTSYEISNRQLNQIQNWRQNRSKMGGLAHHFGGPRRHFGIILGVWAGSGSQVRFGRRFERLLGEFKSQDGSNLKPKMFPSWTQNSRKTKTKIYNFSDGL